MHSTKTIRRFAENEMKLQIGANASWHQDYAESSYVFIANLHYEMTEGDIAIVFSQFGEPVDVHLVRNKKTGKSKGFCFLAYEDQRSTSLCVDNFNAADVCGRTLRVDHVKQFKPPKEYLELKDDDPDFFDKLYKPSGPDGKGWGDFREVSKEEQLLVERQAAQQKQKEQMNEKVLDGLNDLQNQKIVLDSEQRWEKMLMDQEEDEHNLLLKKIQEIKDKNMSMVKKSDKVPKKRVEQETNAEQEERLKQAKKKIKKQKKDKQ